MTQEEQRIYYEKTLADAIGEYKHVSCLVDAIRICVTDIDFEEKFPVSQERYLLVEKMKASEGVQTNLRNSIRFYRAMLKANKPEPWEENEAVRKIGTPCGPVRVVDTDKVSKEELGEMMHHCGQDINEHQPTGYTYKELLGMEVMFVYPHCHKCGYCIFREGADGSECPCVKVELVGGGYICLAKPEQDERPLISFDEEEGSVMDDIREKTEDFLNYIDDIINPKEQ